ncbi:hypothetical protein [Pseudomonas sp. NUPR-001]|uniref:hypothetical protein n=1 Tax=Pseudomonas sp. NUPR-001 TaxID=3416058 RepID=UPI003F9CC9D6
MSFLTVLDQAIKRFTNRFSNLQLRLFAVAMALSHLLFAWAIPSYRSPFLFIAAIGLFLSTFVRRCPRRK